MKPNSLNSLDGFKARVKTVGLPTASHYYIEFLSGKNSDIVGLMCDNINLPGVTIMSTEQRIYGEISDMPYGVAYPPLSLTVLLDNSMVSKTYFDDWSNQVFDRGTRTSGYYRNYTRDIRITLLDLSNKPIYSLIAKECYPKSISDVALDYSNRDVVRVHTTIAFKYWTRENPAELPSIADRIAKLKAIKQPTQPSETSQALPLTSPGSGGSISDYTDVQKFAILSDGTLVPMPVTASVFQFGSSKDFPNNLSDFGKELGGDLSRSSDGVSKSLTGSVMSGADSLKSGFNNLTSNFTSVGGAISDIGKNLTNITAPVSALATGVSSISNTFGAIDTTLSALGLGTPFAKIRQNLNATSSGLSQVAGLKGLPQHIGSIGSSISAASSAMSTVSAAIGKAPGATQSLVNSIKKLGSELGTKGTDTSNASSSMTQYVKDNNL